jgi:hypothetical protein
VIAAFKEYSVLREPVAAPRAEASVGAERKNAPLFEKCQDHRLIGVGGRQTLTTTMTYEERAEKLLRNVQQAWLCRIGYHDQPLSKRETAALNQIILATGVLTLILKLFDVFQASPFDLDKVDELIGKIESLGIRPADQGGFELQPGSPIDKEIAGQVANNSRLARLMSYVTTPDLAAEPAKIAA